MWKEYTADKFHADPECGIPTAILHHMRASEAQGLRRFLNHNVDEEDPEALHGITVMPYALFPSLPVDPILWDRYGGSGAQEKATLLLGLVLRWGDLTHRPLPYDDRVVYFHFLWYAAGGYCEVVEDEKLVTYWCTDLANFLCQRFDEEPDEETHPC